MSDCIKKLLNKYKALINPAVDVRDCKKMTKLGSEPFCMHERIDAFLNVLENRSFVGVLNF